MLDESIIAAGKALRIWNGGMMRRRYQFGHVFQRGKRRRVWVGRWVKPVLVEGELRRVLASKVIGPVKTMSKTQAIQILAGWLKPLNEGSFVPVETTGFVDFYEKWERDLLPSYRESTREFYRSTAARWVKPYFEDWRMEEIRPAELQKFVNLFAGKYSRSVLKHVRATLRCLFNAAVSWHSVRENPCVGLRLPAGKAVERATVLKVEDMARIIEGLDEPYRCMVAIAAATGMRASEVLALRWEDFDPAGRVVNVRRSMYEGVIGACKTRESERSIPYGEGVADALSRLATSRHGSGEYLFVTVRGNFFMPEAVTRGVFKPLARRLGVAEFTWRTFRRSAETAMHNSGVPMKVQQAMLGHSNPKMTLLYAEADSGGKRRAGEDLGKVIFPNLSLDANDVASALPN